jgi:hypothetical protein
LVAEATLLLAGKPTWLATKTVLLATKSVLLAAKPVLLATKPILLATKPILLATKSTLLATKSVLLATESPLLMATESLRLVISELCLWILEPDLVSSSCISRLDGEISSERMERGLAAAAPLLLAMLGRLLSAEGAESGQGGLKIGRFAAACEPVSVRL